MAWELWEEWDLWDFWGLWERRRGGPARAGDGAGFFLGGQDQGAQVAEDGLAGFWGKPPQVLDDLPLPRLGGGRGFAAGGLAHDLRFFAPEEELEEAECDRAGPDRGVAADDLAQGAGCHGQLAGGLGLRPARGAEEIAEFLLEVRRAGRNGDAGCHGFERDTAGAEKKPVFFH